MAKDKRGLFKHLLPLLNKNAKYIWIGGVSTILANGLMLVNPYLIKKAFEAVENKQPSSAVLRLCLIMLALALIAGLFRFIMRRTIIWASRIIEFDLRASMFSRWLMLDRSYYDKARTGDLMAHATNDIEAVRMMIGPGLMHIMNTAVSMVVAVAFMVTLSVKLTLATIFPLFLLALSYHKLGQVVHRKFMTIQEHFAVLTSQVQENLAGVRVVRAYRREESEIERFGVASRRYADMNLDMMKVFGVFRPMLFAIAGGVSLLVLFQGGREMTAGRITLGTLVAFFGYLAWLVWPMMALGWVISLYQRGTASLMRINTILNTNPLVADPVSTPKGAGPVRGKIEFRKLTFAYPSQGNAAPSPILHDVNLTVEPGTRLGITGPTGSGKTTLVSLLGRLYPVAPGQLFIDDIDITQWPLADIRRAIGFVPQETFLFSDTLEANIRFSDDESAPDEVVDSARLTALHGEVETFPGRYQTMIGERGITLSGGQKQRAALARAILKDPRILILDDATSSVDTETEQEIFRNLASVLPGRTAIVISHRVASLVDCDLIVYLDRGRIIEQGGHAELVARNGAYAALYRRQLMEAQLEAM